MRNIITLDELVKIHGFSDKALAHHIRTVLIPTYKKIECVSTVSGLSTVNYVSVVNIPDADILHIARNTSPIYLERVETIFKINITDYGKNYLSS